MKGSKVACSMKRKVKKKYLFPSNFYPAKRGKIR